MPVSLDSLNDEQREAVTHAEGPLLVVAGPGSGKTRVITHRIAWLIEQHRVSPWSILAVTFTNKAAGEMRDRVVQLTGSSGVVVSTFHSFGARFLRMEADRLGLKKDFSIYAQSDALSLLRRILKEADVDTQAIKPTMVAHAISANKNAGITPDQALSTAFGSPDLQIAEAYERYQQVLKDNGAFDFDDLLLEPVKYLRSREDLRADWSRRFQWLLVDEYQDTNGVQYELARLLADQHRNLCVTGDPDQSIYSWRGANIENILGFERDFPEAKTVVLGKNYRSSAVIVAAADALVQHNAQRIERRLSTDNPEGTQIRVIASPTQDGEAYYVGSLIRDWVGEEGIPLSQIAVFYRTNAQSRALENALRNLDLPYVVIGSVEFYRRKEILDLLAWLRLLVNPYDEVAFERAIMNPRRGIGETSIEKIVAAARKLDIDLVRACEQPEVWNLLRGKSKGALAGLGTLLRELSNMPQAPVAPLLQAVVAETNYEAYLMEVDPVRGAERVENVRELITDARDFDEDPDREGAGLPTYLERLALISDTDKWDKDRQAVSLMTLHSAKGLEFDAVVVTGVEDGLIPHSRAIMNPGDDMEEERRLLYVGITRARQHLALTLARHREAFGNSMRNMPSRFLEEIPAELMVWDDPSGMAGVFAGGRRGAAVSAAYGKAYPDSGAYPVADPWDDAGEAPVRPVGKAAKARDPWDTDDAEPVVTPTRGKSRLPEGGDELWEDADTSPGLTRIPGGKSKPTTRTLWDDEDLPPESPTHEDAPPDDDLGVRRVLSKRLPTLPLGGPMPSNDQVPPPNRPVATPGGMTGGTLSTGDRVRHAMFGVGTVVSLSRGSGGVRAKIRFEGWGEKSLALEYAKLEKVR